MTEQLALCWYGVEVRVEDQTDLGLGAYLRGCLPPERGQPSDSLQTVVSYTAMADPGSGPAGGVEYVIRCDGDEVFATDDEEAVGPWLRRDIDQCVARRSPAHIFIHAAVVGWRGLAIVIPGRRPTGKSTLTAELVRRGATYYSDTFAVLDERGWVHAYRGLPSLDAALRPHELRLVREEVAEPLPIGLIVDTSYQPGVSWQPRIVRGPRASLPLIDNTVRSRHDLPGLGTLAEQIAADAVTLRGPRPEAVDLATQLLDLADDAFVSRATVAVGGSPSNLADELARVAALQVHAALPRRLSPPRSLTVTPYLRLPDFLSSTEHQQLLANAITREPQFKQSGVVANEGGGMVDSESRRSRTLAGTHLQEVWPVLKQRVRAMLPYVRQQLNIPWFQLGGLEGQLNAHGDGGFFVPHTDTGHPVAASRRISGVYYFNRQPRRFTGGELRLYDTWFTPSGTTGAATYTTLEPIDNSIVFFPSDAFHEVLPVQADSNEFADSRFAVTIWLHDAASMGARSAEQRS